MFEKYFEKPKWATLEKQNGHFKIERDLSKDPNGSHHVEGEQVDQYQKWIA